MQDKEEDFISYEGLNYSEERSLEKSREFLDLMGKRRSLRMFSDRAVPKEVIENIILTASSAPSGANKQPWTFCAVSNASFKAQIREAAEKEEHINYNGRMSESWLEDLKKFGTDEHKPFLEIAPWLIIVFKKTYDLVNDKKENNYYVNESVGLATGFLLTAIHNAGLVSLTHTPSPMNFLQKLLRRPENERAFLLIPVGYPAENATIPNIKRKKLNEVVVWY